MSQNPYEQNPQYQPPYLQAPQMPYGQPYHPGAYEPVPTTKPEPNSVVKTGFYLILGYALYTLINNIYSTVTLRDRMNATFELQSSLYGEYTQTPSDSVLVTAAVVGIIFSLISIAITVLIAVFYLKGYAWARITAIVLSCIGASFTVLGLVLVFVGVVAGTGTSYYDSLVEPFIMVLSILVTALQIAIIVYMVRPAAVQYTNQSRLWRTYQQAAGPQNPYQQEQQHPYGI